MGLMTNRDFQNYSSLFELMESTVKAPDLLFKKLIPNLVGQIHKRGREYESTISSLFKSFERTLQRGSTLMTENTDHE
jgi:deoxyadenosine/deoxycytidine kinase